MSSVKAVLYKFNKNKDGTMPIYIRITKDSKQKYIPTEIFLEEKHWNDVTKKVRTNHPNSTRLNNLIFSKLVEAQNIIYDKEKDRQPVTAIGLQLEMLTHRKNEMFIEFAERHMKMLGLQNKLNVKRPEESRLNNFKEFLNHRDIAFHEITVRKLQEFQIWLMNEKEVSQRTIMNHMLSIRTLYNKAIYEGLIKRDLYPFGRGKISIKRIESQKIGLDEDEILALEGLILEENTPLWHAKNLFLFSFYTAGMRVSDLLRLKWSDIHQGRLFYTMGKNNKKVSFKLPEKARNILKFYKEDKENRDDYIFPELKNTVDNKDVLVKINTSNKTINKYLKKLGDMAGIKKNMSMHIARHSFGNIAGDKIPMPMLQKLYRHSSLETTAIYQQSFITKDVDDALNDVLNF